MRWLDTVLEPAAGLPDERRRLLASALALTLGPDSLVIMKDVCRLEDAEAVAVLRWAAVALLRAGLDEEGLGAPE
jgi:alkylhydroperoxidase family enzyme